MGSVWQTLPKPILALAPMEDVTDTVFRRLIQSWGRPDLVFTEFIHASMVLRPRVQPGLSPRLQFESQERPVIAQIWGNEPESYARASARLHELGFDGIDINMGCPARKIRRKGACAALIENPALAAELIAAAKSGGLPVSVKTRIGFDSVVTEPWCGHLLEQSIAALTVHGRVAMQESDGLADWSQIGVVSRLAREMGVATQILGNGDVESRAHALSLAARYDLDGIMVGRGVLRDPYFFRRDGRRFADTSSDERVGMLLAHLSLYEQHWGETRNYEILKKYYKVYLTGDDTLLALRERLNRTRNYGEARQALSRFHAEVV